MAKKKKKKKLLRLFKFYNELLAELLPLADVNNVPHRHTQSKREETSKRATNELVHVNISLSLSLGIASLCVQRLYTSAADINKSRVNLETLSSPTRKSLFSFFFFCVCRVSFLHLAPRQPLMTERPTTPANKTDKRKPPSTSCSYNYRLHLTKSTMLLWNHLKMAAASIEDLPPSQEEEKKKKIEVIGKVQKINRTGHHDGLLRKHWSAAGRCWRRDEGRRERDEEASGCKSKSIIEFQKRGLN